MANGGQINPETCQKQVWQPIAGPPRLVCLDMLFFQKRKERRSCDSGVNKQALSRSQQRLHHQGSFTGLLSPPSTLSRVTPHQHDISRPAEADQAVSSAASPSGEMPDTLKVMGCKVFCFVGRQALFPVCLQRRTQRKEEVLRQAVR